MWGSLDFRSLLIDYSEWNIFHSSETAQLSPSYVCFPHGDAMIPAPGPSSPKAPKAPRSSAAFGPSWAARAPPKPAVKQKNLQGHRKSTIIPYGGRNPAPVDKWLIHVYPIIFRVPTIQGAGFVPSTVSFPNFQGTMCCNTWKNTEVDTSRNWLSWLPSSSTAASEPLPSPARVTRKAILSAVDLGLNIFQEISIEIIPKHQTCETMSTQFTADVLP